MVFDFIDRLYLTINRVLELYDNHLIANTVIDKFKPNNLPYKYNDNSDGSYFQWETDYLTRMFNDEVRKRECLKSYKEKIYRNQDTNFTENANKESFDTISDSKNFKCFNVDIINKHFKYLFSNDNENLYIYVLADKEVYRDSDDYFVEVYFVDNGTNDYEVLRATIHINQNPNIEFLYLDDCNFQYMNFADKILIKVIVPIEKLNMDFGASDNKINYNIIFNKKICGEMAITYEYLSVEDPIFLRLKFEY